MNSQQKIYIPQLKDIQEAAKRLQGVIKKTPLEYNPTYSEKYQADIYFKREDQQVVRSYKIRGAYNKIASLPQERLKQGIVCASAGNHAQGVALSCFLLKARGVIYMPTTTPQQKIKRVKTLGKEWVEVVLFGDTFDDANTEALKFTAENNMPFIPPFDDAKVIEGQGTIGMEILEELPETDFIFIPVGGGGLTAGLSTYIKQNSTNIQLIGVEPQGAPAMYKSIKADQIVTLPEIDKFVDGAAVQRVGEFTFPICKKYLDDMLLVPEGRVCTKILELYNNEAIVAEPAGVLSVAALEQYKEHIKGKKVVCIISGGNNDITRTEEIKERSMLYEGLKHYFIVRFPQRPGALKEFVNQILGPTDNIVLFEYAKKINREKGPALVGIELKEKADFEPLLERMKAKNFFGEYVNNKQDLFAYLI
ncbi:threonine ammonia-lyase IlvA [Saccharicrinis fermentans]|uniref:L-threonine dehydratase n=1 Tax=Saccharicrinis fermentans DSM 9555 = JCM 21142 TaxID=869213 RepID=W7Y1D6_9BACT|nr:threonine ammonia-lyase IlvA [Saccharicrinis fermentans]GAF01777.1 L-threonine dehydratase biosynthetic IlvA [Saccharicrinis fermentans DSM 9555 = JCM 21142]